MKVADIIKAPKPRNLQLHRTLSGTKGGPMRDKKKELERGKEKHKGRAFEELDEGKRIKKADALFPDFWSWLLNNGIADEDELYEVLDTSYNMDTYETSLVSALKEEIGKKHIKDEQQRAFKHIKFLANFCITGSNGQVTAKIRNAIPTYAEEALEHLTSRWDRISEGTMMGGGQARRALGDRVPYDSFKAWFADLPNGASTVVDEATAVTTAHGRSKDFEGVCGKFDSKKNEGWIYEHYLKKSNLGEGRRHVYGPGDEMLTSHPNKLMQRIGKGEEIKVMTKSGVAKIQKVQFYNGGMTFKLDREVKLADGSRGAWVDPREVSFDLDKDAAPDAKAFAHKHATGK